MKSRKRYSSEFKAKALELVAFGKRVAKEVEDLRVCFITESQPLEDRSELHESKKSRRKFFIPRSNRPEFLETLESIFDSMAFLVFLFVIWGGVDPIRFWRNTTSETDVFEKRSEIIGIIRFIGQDCDAVRSSVAEIDSEERIVAISGT